MKSISIVLTVHNKAALLVRVLNGIRKNMSEYTKELIMVFDGCTDNSIPLFKAYIKNNSFPVPYDVVITPDVHELLSNNAGIRAASKSWVLLIQDDMVMMEKGFDAHLLGAALKYPDIFAVTGRAAHNVVRAQNGNLVYPDLLGWDNRPPRNRVYIRDVINRGPILFDLKRMKRLGLFDKEFAPCNQDDHDICFRAYRHGWLCGSAWIDYVSPAAWGTSRCTAKGATIINKAIARNAIRLYERHHDLIDGPKHNEERPI